MVNGGGPQRDSDPDGIGDELLDQWQERLSGGEDPVGALADVLAGRGRKRSELFSRVGTAVLGYRLERILGAGYAVEASYGHIRDLPHGADQIPQSIKNEPWARLGVNLDKDFELIAELTGQRVERLVLA